MYLYIYIHINLDSKTAKNNIYRYLQFIWSWSFSIGSANSMFGGFVPTRMQKSSISAWDLWKGVRKQQQTTIYCPTKLSSHPARFATPCFLNRYNVWVWPYVTFSSECSLTIPIAYINLSKRSFEVSWNFRTSHLFLLHHLFHHPYPFPSWEASASGLPM